MHSKLSNHGHLTVNHWLDVCRASAILLVLLSHGRRLLFPIFPDAQYFKFGGFLGVEIFFVLSGFLIGKILLTKSMASNSRWRWIPNFWGRRWLRTYPNYILFLMLNLLTIDSWRPDVMPQWLHYLTFTQSLWSAHPSFFGEAWSLVIEEIFYFIIPLLMVGMWRDCAMRALLRTLFLVLMVSLTLRIIVVYSSPELTFNSIRSTALLRLDSIMIGVLASYMYWKNEKYKHRIYKLAPWLVLLLIPVILVAMQSDSVMDESPLFKIFLFPMANLGAVGFLIMGLNWSFNHFFYKMIERIARWSYSAYLTNLLVLSFMGYYLPPPTKVTAFFYWLFFITSTLICSAIIYHKFERNIMLWRDRWIK